MNIEDVLRELERLDMIRQLEPEHLFVRLEDESSELPCYCGEATCERCGLA